MSGRRVPIVKRANFSSERAAYANNNKMTTLPPKKLSSDIRDCSESSSRSSLRESLLKRQNSLTPAEFNYLDELCIKGNDVEVQLAKTKLQDDELFFEPIQGEEPSKSDAQNDTILETPACRDNSASESSPTVELLSFPSGDDESFTSGNPKLEMVSVGSERRMVLLKERRNSHLFGKMWKAHENGVILSKQGSRRSLMRRNTLATNSEIFRNELMDDVRSDNNRRLSTKSRSKSVSFKDSPMVDATIRGLPPNRKFYSRSSSIGSLPSIRQAHVLSSSSTSISSLRRGSALFEESFSSIASPPQIPTPNPFSTSSRLSSVASLHRAHSIHSEGRDEDFSEKKLDDDILEIQLDTSSSVVLQEATQLLSHHHTATRSTFMRDTSVGEGIEVSDNLLDILPCSSFDESVSHHRTSSTIFRRRIQRTYSDESLAARKYSATIIPDDVSWKLEEDDDDVFYDPWKVIEDEYVNGYGGGGTLPFSILGTSADDKASHPHVLSPPLMESLQAFLPIAQSGDNFWMKYSLVRDGASMYTFLQRARGAQNSVLAIETIDGEVFGAFTGSAWRKNWNFFGTSDAFLWKMRHSRRTKCHSIIDQAHLESEIDVYPYTGANSCIQLCLHDKLAVGGGTSDTSGNEENKAIADFEWGFGLTVEGDFLQGTSSPCLTFGSPSLSEEHRDGSLFEIMNLELWTLTPCTVLADAEKLELGKLFLDHHQKQ